MSLRSLAVAGLLTCALSGTAHAAVAPACSPATMLPRATQIPANLPGFGFDALKATAANVHLTHAGQELPLTVGPVTDGFLKIAPQSPLVVGDSYSLDYDVFCFNSPTKAPGPIAFTVTAEAPIPTKLGDPTGEPTVKVQDFGTSKVSLTQRFTFAAEMKPWAQVYELYAILDGRVVETKPTATADSVDVDVVAWCDEAMAKSGTHTLTLAGRIPFSPVVKSSDKAVAFTCTAPKVLTPPATTPTQPPPPPASGGSSSSASGCAMHGPPGTGSGGALLALATVLAVRAVRRAKGGR